MIQAIVDTGVILAALDETDQDNVAANKVLHRRDLRFVFPQLVVGEVLYFIQTRFGADIEANFLRGLGSLRIESPHPGDWSRIAELVERYRNFPLGHVDASVIGLAERLRASTILTLDQRHFRAVKPKHVDHFTILPEL